MDIDLLIEITNFVSGTYDMTNVLLEKVYNEEDFTDNLKDFNSNIERIFEFIIFLNENGLDIPTRVILKATNDLLNAVNNKDFIETIDSLEFEFKPCLEEMFNILKATIEKEEVH
ncbi:MAG: hypothetical protein ACK5LT_04750 [Lachnospirales bacterium]